MKLDSKLFSNFYSRHVGPDRSQVQEMLAELGCDSLDQFISKVIPDSIKLSTPLSFENDPLDESELLACMRDTAEKNEVWKSFIGQGYFGTLMPAVIQRNILENPGWYTQYTPYQPEISQGRLEALLNFQTVVSDLTGLPVANASLLDEATAAAEAMYLAYNFVGRKKPAAKKFFVDSNVYPQTLAVIKTRARGIGIEVVVADYQSHEITDDYFAIYLQYPAADGAVVSYADFIQKAKEQNVLAIVGTDLLALCLLAAPAELGADIAVGSAQRFGVPFGFGGPHAAFFACRTEYQRLIPGRIVGVSKDKSDQPALRLALQTREQHIRRDKATSNICTAQVLLAVLASMYAVYHGPKGLKAIAERVHGYAVTLSNLLKADGIKLASESFFDTLCIEIDPSVQQQIRVRAAERKVNLSFLGNSSLQFSVDEATNEQSLIDLLYVLTGSEPEQIKVNADSNKLADLSRSNDYLNQAVFNSYHTEAEFVRYIKRLEAKDLSLMHSMIPLGSCTMKLNATTEMLPVTWNEFSNLHPYAPVDQTLGYQQLVAELNEALKLITGFDVVSLQPNAGSQGEFAGMLAIKAYLESIGQAERNVCLIPASAHGTNPATAVIAGYKVVPVASDENGNINIADLELKISEHKDELAALMVTYPSTHGVFEAEIKNIAQMIHDNGGQVYLDGANLNAMVGLVAPADLGADVMHINLHKTFCIPHGGGGPGVGPIAARSHLADFMPADPLSKDYSGFGPVSAANFGSASILPISLAYIQMMGAEGLTEASKIAILNANYIAARLSDYYPVLYRGQNGMLAHECIIDCRGFKDQGIEVEDIAKRLIDYGFHAPTMSWPVPGTMMIEPTESESKKELDRFIDAMIGIYNEIEQIKSGTYTQEDNPLKGAPHTAQEIASDDWAHSYSREVAAYPNEDVRVYKFWPAVGRIDNAYGDRNLMCSCGG